jgi:glycerate 2-kinase
MESIPSSVKSYFEEDSFERETPKQEDYDRRGVKVHNIVIADNIIMCLKAIKEATKLGIKAHVFSTGIEGEAKDVGKMLAGIAKTIHNVGTPFEPPCLLIAGGETTVSIQGENHGEGGRNQEMVLSAAQEISGFDRIFIASIATDGTDGPTNIAGAIVDGNTVELAERKGINIEEELEKHNSSSVFRRIKDAVYTYDTGTNLMDLMVIYVT